MVFEPNFTKVVSSSRRHLGTTQSIIELKLPTNENDISRVYSVGAKSMITSFGNDDREITYNGVVNFQVVCEGSAGVVGLDYTAEFKDRFLNEYNAKGELIFTSYVVDVSYNLIGGGIKVVAVVEVSVDEIVSVDLNVLTGLNEEKAHLSSDEIEYSTYLGRAFEKFDVNDEFELQNATNILMVTPCVSLGRVDPKDNYMVVNGKLNLNVCYQNGEGVNSIATHHHETDFSFEVAFDSVNEDDLVQSMIDVVVNEIKVTSTIENGVARVNLYVPVNYSGYVFSKNRIMAVKDLYLEKKYLAITCENFDTLICNDSVAFKDNISGTASILETSPFIDEVLGACSNNLVLASCKINDNLLCVEGIANATVIYYTKDTNEITSIEIEMPFAVEQRVECDKAGVVSLCLQNLTARSKRGKEIEVSAELYAFVDTYSHRQECVITNVALGEDKPHEECALYVYIVRPNQTIWDVAKENNISQDLLLEQNPEIQLPIKAGDKLVVYRPNNIEF